MIGCYINKLFSGKCMLSEYSNRYTIIFPVRSAPEKRQTTGYITDSNFSTAMVSCMISLYLLGCTIHARWGCRKRALTNMICIRFSENIYAKHLVAYTPHRLLPTLFWIIYHMSKIIPFTTSRYTIVYTYYQIFKCNCLFCENNHRINVT